MVSQDTAKLVGVKVGDLSGTFYVPAYQRGYRWGEEQVLQLLDDVWGSNGAPYYLQPVVVKPYGASWELVDGQQRLTTLYLIFHYMQVAGLKNSGANYSIEYETRSQSAAFLDALGTETVDDLGENIDFFHMRAAYRVIEEWFEARGHRRQVDADTFYGRLYNSVEVIWYEVDDTVDSTDLFTRLNVGKIPLTDAELIKAQLLSSWRGRAGEEDRTREVMAQWDTIERELHDPEMWAFVAGARNASPTRIDLVFELLADAIDPGRLRRSETFEYLRATIMGDPERFWSSVLERHAVMRWWFDDRTLFHKIGFLTSQGESLTHLDALSRDRTKSSFERELTRLISSRLALSEQDLRDLDYESNYVKSLFVLTLMNVQSVSQLQHSTERYSFAAHRQNRWSLEHIHAQHSEPLRTEAAWREWFALHRVVIEDLPTLSDDERRAICAEIDDVLETFTMAGALQVEPVVTAALTLDDEADEVHALDNLALLSSENNSALNNSVFEVKRRKINELERAGAFVPIATRWVFLKYFTGADAHHMHFWTSADREAYMEAIVATLSPYLTEEG